MASTPPASQAAPPPATGGRRRMLVIGGVVALVALAVYIWREHEASSGSATTPTSPVPNITDKTQYVTIDRRKLANHHETKPRSKTHRGTTARGGGTGAGAATSGPAPQRTSTGRRIVPHLRPGSSAGGAAGGRHFIMDQQ